MRALTAVTIVEYWSNGAHEYRILSNTSATFAAHAPKSLLRYPAWPQTNLYFDRFALYCG